MTQHSSSIAGGRLTVGSLTVHALSDGVFRVPSFFFADPEALASLDPAPGTAPGSAWGSASGSASTEPELPIGAFLVPGDQPLLIDAGVGPVDFQGSGNLVGGSLLAELATAGCRPEDIATVALTHLHPDHVGWLGTPDGEPVFSNARVVVGAGDWEAFVEQAGDSPLEMEPHLRAALRTMFDAGQVELVHGETPVTSAVTAVPAPGHTPGHQVFAIQDGSERLLILGDAAYCPDQLTHADWDVVSDVDPDQARATRRRLLAESKATGASMVGCHFQHFRPSRALAL